MSSWANRNVLRKRDISQIPDDARPLNIPRILRDEVVLSETFQKNEINTVAYNNRSNRIIENNRKISQYTIKEIHSLPEPSAIELLHENKTFVFVILRHLRNVQDNDLWITSYNSIRKYYTNKIVIIDDNSKLNTVNGKLFNTEIIYSEFPGAGEILPYYYFLKYKWANKMIFLHDSMSLNRGFLENEIRYEIKFHWYFHNHESRDTRKILQYISMLNDNKDIYDYANNPDSNWKGCFGATSIIDIDVVSYLDNKYNLFSTLVLFIKTRNDRETFERIFGIISYYENIIKGECSNFGNIVEYPSAFESQNNNPETSSHIVRQRGYNTAIIKVWRGR
jgi:hypothetical protein